VRVANQFDVAGRLAEGRPAVDDLEEYVAACRRLGYQHRDLTAQPTQVRDWYEGEAGMDLRALDADHGVLSAAAVAAEDAARMQAGLASELAAAWSGTGASAANEFLWRSCQAAQAVSVAVRAAADAVATLRDSVWRAVDAKVAATEAVDARQQPQRAEWLAAARAVTCGAGDLAAASELIDQRVKPFVNLDVGADWLAAMRSAIASINAAYDAAVAGTTAVPRAVFDVPGDLGPDPEPSTFASTANVRESTPPPSPAAQTLPAAAIAPAVSPAPPAAPWSGPVPAAPTPLTNAAPAPPAALPSAALPSSPLSSPLSSSPMGDLGAGPGFGQQLADLIGGLVGAADSEAPDHVDDMGSEDPDVPEDPETPEDPEAPEESAADDEPVAEESAADEPAAEEPAPEPPVEPEPLEPEPEPHIAPAPPPPEPEVAYPTPCEIAADELPQVGE
jgi:hypothetical protein